MRRASVLLVAFLAAAATLSADVVTLPAAASMLTLGAYTTALLMKNGIMATGTNAGRRQAEDHRRARYGPRIDQLSSGRTSPCG